MTNRRYKIKCMNKDICATSYIWMIYDTTLDRLYDSKEYNNARDAANAATKLETKYNKQ